MLKGAGFRQDAGPTPVSAFTPMLPLSRFALPLLVVLALVCVAPDASAQSRRNNRNRVMKSIDISDDPAVVAAQKTRAEAAKEYQAAQAKMPSDKAAVEASKAKLAEATKALSETRKKAFEAARKKQR